MKDYNPYKRIAFQTANQFAIMPTFGITWGGDFFKFSIAFMWLCFQCRIGVFKRWDDNE